MGVAGRSGKLEEPDEGGKRLRKPECKAEEGRKQFEVVCNQTTLRYVLLVPNQRWHAYGIRRRSHFPTVVGEQGVEREGNRKVFALELRIERGIL